MKKNILYLSTTVLILFASLFYSNLLAAQPKFGQNIARKRFFRSNLIPNYSLTQDRLDNLQLTDGKNATTSFIWTDKKCVGWSGVDKLILTIDLGKDQPISGVSYSTAAGSSGVKYPTAIQLSVGTSRSKMHNIGELIQLSGKTLDNGSYNTVKLTAKGLKTHGRYVRFTILDARYVFIDEIEVYAGKPEWLKLAYGTNAHAVDMSTPAGIALFKARQRLGKDISALTKIIKTSTVSSDKQTALLQRVALLKPQVDKFTFGGSLNDFKAIIPFAPLQEKLLAIYAELLRAQGFKPLTVWHKYRYAPLSIWEKPQMDKRLKLTLRMMKNEHRAEVLNLTNTTDKKLVVNFSLSNLPTGIEVRQVEYVDTRELKITATALTLAKVNNGLYSTTIPAGMTRQLWFTVSSKKITPGIYKGAVKIASTALNTSVPFTIKVENIQFPTQLTLSTFVFDYAGSYNYGINSDNIKTVIEDMKSHLVNVPIANRTLGAVPTKADFDAAGNLTAKLDFSAFDRWLKVWPDAKHYFIFFGITVNNSKFAGFKPGTTAFNKAIAGWAHAWDNYLQRKNIAQGKVIFHFLDEPHTAPAYKIIDLWINAFKTNSKYVKVFNDPNKLSENFSQAKHAFRNLDIICPLDFRYRREYSAAEIDYLQSFVKAPNKALWFYMCFGPSRHFDPSYYRLQPWSAAKVGATGSGFWSYSDQRCVNPWNEYYKTSSRSYSMIYLHDNKVTPTKHWEAFREGIEDYEYLQMLKKALPEMAKQLTATTVNKTLKVWKPYNVDWLPQNPGKYVEQARLKILDALSQ